MTSAAKCGLMRLEMNIRVDDKYKAEFTALAKHNKRSVSKETEAAIEERLKKHRKELAAGPKLNPR